MRASGFNIRKWESNVSALVDELPTLYRNKLLTMDISEDNTVKTIGVYWQPRSDLLGFKMALLADERATKRIVLSDISKFLCFFFLRRMT